MAVQTEKNNDKRKTNEQAPGGFGEVLRFIREQPRIQDLLIFTALITFFGLSVLNIFPSVASEVLGGGAETLGLLLGASGAGAFVSTIFVVPFTQAVRRTGVMLTGALVWVGMWIIVLSLSKWLPLSMAATFMFSIGAPVVITTSIGLLQIMSPPNMRARLQSTLFMFSFGLQPVASLFVGFTAERLGTPTTIQINGLLMIVGAVLLLAARANLRTWEVKRVETVTAAPVEAVL
jgi:predicted MFS family arabinose efflux permease